MSSVAVKAAALLNVSRSRDVLCAAHWPTRSRSPTIGAIIIVFGRRADAWCHAGGGHRLQIENSGLKIDQSIESDGDDVLASQHRAYRSRGAPALGSVTPAARPEL